MKLQELKKPLLYATIGLFAISALMGIYLILVPTNSTFVGRISATSSILGLFALCSLNSVTRLESDKQYVRTLSVVTIISNLIWTFPWILIVWDALKLNTLDAALTLWKIVGTAAIVAFNCALAANFLDLKHRNQVINVLIMLTIGTALFIGLILLVLMWTPEIFPRSLAEIIGRLVAVGIIVLIFGMVVTPILSRSEGKKYNKPVNSVDENALRDQIEREVRAKIAAEQAAAAQPAAESIPQEAAPSEPVKADDTWTEG